MSRFTCGYQATGDFVCSTGMREGFDNGSSSGNGSSGAQDSSGNGSSGAQDSSGNGSSGAQDSSGNGSSSSSGSSSSDGYLTPPDCLLAGGCPVGHSCQDSGDCVEGLYCTNQVCSDRPTAGQSYLQGGWWPVVASTDGSQTNATSSSSSGGILGEVNNWMSDGSFNLDGAGGSGTGWFNVATVQQQQQQMSVPHHKKHHHHHHHNNT